MAYLIIFMIKITSTDYWGTVSVVIYIYIYIYLLKTESLDNAILAFWLA